MMLTMLTMLTMLLWVLSCKAPEEAPVRCAEDHWNEYPTKDAIYVDASASEAGSGTASSPYASLETAISNAKDGSVILLSAGEYTGEFEIKHDDVAVVGRCREVVNLKGSESVAVINFLSTAKNATLEGVTVSAEHTRIGVIMTGDGQATMRSVNVIDGLYSGIQVLSETALTAEDVRVIGAACNPEAVIFGCSGIYVSNFASLTLGGGSLLQYNEGHGVNANGGSVTISDTTVTDTFSREQDLLGIGIQGVNGATVTLKEGTVVRSSMLSGVYIADSTLFSSGQVLIEESLGLGYDSDAYGLAMIRSTGRIEAGLSINTSDRAAILSEQESNLTVTGATITSSGLNGSQIGAVQIVGATLELSQSTIDASANAGVVFFVAGEGSRLSDVSILDSHGAGIALFDSSVVLDNVTIEEVDDGGQLITPDGTINVDGIGVLAWLSELTVETSLTIRDTKDFGLAARQSTVDITGLTVEGARSAGVALIASTGRIDTFSIEAVEPNAAQDWGGYGVYLSLSDVDGDYDPPDESGITLAQGTISESSSAGLLIEGDQPVTVQTLSVSDTAVSADGDNGDGIVAISAGDLDLSRLTLQRCARCALLLDDTTGTLTDSQSSDNACGIQQQNCKTVDPLDVDSQLEEDIAEGISLCSSEAQPLEHPAMSWNSDIEVK